MLRESWLSGDMRDASTIEWINRLREMLSEVIEVVCARKAKAKMRMKVQYDKHAKQREFVLGTLVLVQTRDLEGKL